MIIPNNKLDILTKIHLVAIFDGRFDANCIASLTIRGSTSGIVHFLLDFRVYYPEYITGKNIVQNSKDTTGWKEELVSELPDLLAVNDIEVVIGPELFHTTINGDGSIIPPYPVITSEMFERLVILYTGSCFTFNLDKSYIKSLCE